MKGELLTTLGWLVIVYVAYRLGREDGRIRVLGGRVDSPDRGGNGDARSPSMSEILQRAAARGEWKS